MIFRHTLKVIMFKPKTNFKTSATALQLPTQLPTANTNHFSTDSSALFDDASPNLDDSSDFTRYDDVDSYLGAAYHQDNEEFSVSFGLPSIYLIF